MRGVMRCSPSVQDAGEDDVDTPDLADTRGQDIRA